MTQPELPNTTRAARLRVLRIIWAALLMGQLMFLAVIMLVIWPNDPDREPLPPEQRNVFLIVLGVMLLGMLPASYLIRRSLYGQPTGDGGIAPERYATGNIIFWAMSEGVGLFALVCMLLDRKPWPFLAIALVAMANQAINFPTGGPLEPTGPRRIHPRS